MCGKLRAWGAVACVGAILSGCAAPPIELEAESGRLEGAMSAATRPAYTGTGYVTGLDADRDRVVFDVTAPRDGLYDVRIRFAAPEGPKAYALDVNGVKVSGHFPRTPEGQWAEHVAGKVELRRGSNALALEKGWGYYDVDAIRLTPTGTPGRPPRPPPVPVNADATPEARALLDRLVAGYGRTTLSGVYSLDEAEHVARLTGRRPSILGDDLMDYSPSRVERGTTPEGTVEKVIRAARDTGAIVTLSWHWNAPTGLIDREIVDDRGNRINALWYKGFNTNATTFDFAAALADPQSAEYALILRDIDAIAVQLRKFADAGMPVLWRPLHEADGGWFWWGARGPEAFKALWALTYDRLTRHHGLHNLIWVYTGTANFDWYPPDDQFDIIGIDAYPPDRRDPLGELWEQIQARYAGRKLLAVSEFTSVPDVARMHRVGARWAYFVPWTGRSASGHVADEVIREVYADPHVHSLPAPR